MKNVRCYDNGGATADRYTVVFMEDIQKRPGVYGALGMDASPFHPLGIGQYCTAMPGRHLGRRIKFEELPDDCQKAVLQYLK